MHRTGRGAAPGPRSWLIPGLLVAVAWVVSLPRMIPVLTLDRGIFVSVAERLLAGDRLYSGVWDNKDPFFYDSIALGRAVSPDADVVLEVLWVLLACAGTWSLARSLGASSRRALVVGFALAPVVLTGGVYLPGYSHLPGVALSMLSIAALVRGRPVVAGLLLGLLVPFKLVLVPVLAVALVVLLLRRGPRDALRVGIGAAVAVGAAVLVLALRGELLPYLGSLALNAAYAQSASLLDPSLPAPLAHLVRVERAAPDVAAGAIAAGLVWSGWSAVRGRAAHPLRCRLWAASLVCALASLAVLAATGLWPQHDQVLLLPALLVLVLAATRSTVARRTLPRPLQVAALAVLAVLLSGPTALGPAWAGYRASWTGAPAALAALHAVPPETALLLARSRASSYARVGQNHDHGHAYGLRAWRLACPRFDQYPFDPPRTLAADLACLPRARYVVESWDAVPVAGATAWNRYLEGVRGLLSRDYDCTVTRGIRVCERRAPG